MNLERIIPRAQAKELGERLRSEGKRVASISGSFDLFHAGHLQFIERARKEGDALVVLLNSDSSVRGYKGPGRPIIPEDRRATILAALRAVDYVIIFDDLVPNAVLAELKPDVLVNGMEYGEDCIERSTIESYGGRIVVHADRLDSTSALLKRIADAERMPSVRAVLFDRDGTLIEDPGYLHRPEDVVWKEGAMECLRLLQSAGYKLAIITNQSGIGRGLYTEADMARVHEHMKRELATEGITLDGIYHCPHRPDDGCACRKPDVGLMLQAAEDLSLDLSKSWLVGNACSDIEAGRMANMRTVLVYNKEDCIPGPSMRSEDLLDAANRILALP